MRGQETVVPTSVITVREHLELEIAAQAKHLESIIQNQARQLELQIIAEVKRLEDLRAATDLRYMQLRGADELALRAALVSAEKAVQAALEAAKEAVLKAEVATEKRLSLLNELRSGVATREQMQALEQRLSDIKERVDKNEATILGRSGGLKDYIGWILALVTLAGFVVAMVMLGRK